MSDNAVLDKSYQFALRVVRLYKHLSEAKQEWVLSKQLLNTGTHVGAHVKAAQEAESRADFFHEMNVALKMASKTEYWLQILRDGEFLDEKQFASINADCAELLKLLTVITKPTRRAQEN